MLHRDAPPAAGHDWPGDRGGHLWEKDREAVTRDGARIRYTVRGEDGPWIVLCAGFLCPDNFWRYLVPALEPDHRVVVLNYRGVGASTDPRPPGPRSRNVSSDDYTIGRFAWDVRAVLDAEDAGAVTVLGHSMGCKVALETWRQERQAAGEESPPNRVSSLVLVTGPYASPLKTFYDTDVMARLFPFLYTGIGILPRRAQYAITRSLRLPVAMPVARLVKALGPDTPEEAMEGYLHHFGEVDPMIALKIAKGMHQFDAEPWLGEVDVPTQVIVGTEDRFSPPELGRHIVDAVPEAELVTIEGGTHGAIIEFPDQIAAAVRDFMERVRQ